MEKRKVDVAVIGTGTAGMVAYKAARKHTENLVVIEGDQYGTTCARVGCMPSKLLIAAAEAAHNVTGADLFGIHAEGVKIDGKAVMERVRRERDLFVGGVLETVESFPPEHRLKGMARFIDDHRLVVGGQVEIEARSFVIATGSRSNIPEFLQAAGDRLLVNDTVFELEDLPESVAVFGPGIIGLELGQALSRLGVRIRMFGVSGSIGAIRDEALRDYAQETFNREFPLDPSANVSAVERTAKGVRVTFEDEMKGEVSEEFDYLLAATGRRPNVDRLDLQNTGLELDDRGVPIFDHYTLRCSKSHIFIAGDADNEAPVLHEATDEGRIAGDNAGRYPDMRAGLRRVPLSIVFTDPQIATVGLTLDQVQERCRDSYATGELSFEDQGRSRVIGKDRGILKVYGEHGSGLFLGAEIFGPAAEHIGHLLAWAAQKHMTVSEMLDMPFYHPVIEEGVRSALRDLNRKLNIGPELVDRCLECGPGA
ncbi:dihydrolipoyl dehydrogenase [Marinobacter nanhaiticus D15-8W]|uniref:Dihydrolipoyl dehydrogenase n=1 Tax=Marinobacter nanhaiticus D15-8W TaxID=626887 RepID=N6X3W5_9GAMM|nr:dihydrolipoyl dehydrogenase [Marinobacter nanhaiticus]ENO15738.1 dihydrolipoyl dehydrogenase [Marinobacter nanhaiticus D15-8W]BES73404.1 dihydrolipoyl dehydrogenase [Marinobacter nanhaiticus D15-8W]